MLANGKNLMTDMVNEIIQSALLIRNLKVEKGEGEYNVLDKGSKLYREKVNIAKVSTKTNQLENEEDIHINNNFLFLEKAVCTKNEAEKVDMKIHSLTGPVHSAILSKYYLS